MNTILKEIEQFETSTITNRQHLENTYDILRYIKTTPIAKFGDEFAIHLTSNIGWKNNWVERVINNKSKRGIFYATWYINGMRYTGGVHIMIFQYFSQDTNLRGYVIHHIDGNPYNNTYPNLIKLTRKEHTGYRAYVKRHNLDYNKRNLNGYLNYIQNKKQETV